MPSCQIQILNTCLNEGKLVSTSEQHIMENGTTRRFETSKLCRNASAVLNPDQSIDLFKKLDKTDSVMQ